MWFPRILHKTTKDPNCKCNVGASQREINQATDHLSIPCWIIQFFSFSGIQFNIPVHRNFCWLT
ncbi:hypothetical protein HanIR_Chr10g0501721 [Helianthus annuus]|nr:hypothetical protein HanIR_Chr10g0501721 [Helianthus annuus]